MPRRIQQYFERFTTTHYFGLTVMVYLLIKLYTKDSPSSIPIPIDPTIQVKHWTKKTDWKFNQSTVEDDFQLIEEELSTTLHDGEALFETLFISIDKYTIMSDQSSFVQTIGNLKTISGETCSRVIKSRNDALPVDAIFLSNSGWRTHFKSSNRSGEIRHILPKYIEEISPSIALNYLGMPGLSALFAFEKVQAKKNDVIVIGGADGAFGSVLGQLAKEKGCKVIGFASTNQRVEWLKTIAGFDFAFNYKNTDIKSAMNQVGTNHINTFFDHIGGKFFSTIFHTYMASGGHIYLCSSHPEMQELTDCLRIPASSDIIQARYTLFDKIKSRTIKYQEAFTKGFEQIPRMLVDVLSGKNDGEAIIKVNSFYG